MHVIDQPITKPPSFFIICRFNFQEELILYGRICNSLVALHALPTETPLSYANRSKDFRGEFSN
jgi:hypothetical protein